MITKIRRAALLGASALAMGLAPLALDTVALPGLGDTAAYAGNGNGKDNGRSNTGGGTHSTQPANAGGANPNRGGPKNVETNDVELVGFAGQPEGFEPPGQLRQKNIHALAGGLNSIVRDIHGLVNGNDPKMDGIEQFVIDNAEYRLALAALETALGVQSSTQFTYDAYVAGLLAAAALDPAAYADLSPEGLQASLDALEAQILLADPSANPALDPNYAALAGVLASVQTSQQLTDLNAANSSATSAQIEADAAMEGTTMEDLIAALDAGSNPNRNYTNEQLMLLYDWADPILLGKVEDLLNDPELLAKVLEEQAALAEESVPL